jgi:hypothetical protein
MYELLQFVVGDEDQCLPTRLKLMLPLPPPAQTSLSPALLRPDDMTSLRPDNPGISGW